MFRPSCCPRVVSVQYPHTFLNRFPYRISKPSWWLAYPKEKPCNLVFLPLKYTLLCELLKVAIHSLQMSTSESGNPLISKLGNCNVPA